MGAGVAVGSRVTLLAGLVVGLAAAGCLAVAVGVAVAVGLVVAVGPAVAVGAAVAVGLAVAMGVGEAVAAGVLRGGVAEAAGRAARLGAQPESRRARSRISRIKASARRFFMGMDLLYSHLICTHSIIYPRLNELYVLFSAIWPPR